MIFRGNGTIVHTEKPPEKVSRPKPYRNTEFSIWEGTWDHTVENKEGYIEEIKITNTNPLRFSFHLHSMLGQNIGDIEGIAYYTSNDTAVFDDRVEDPTNWGEGCRLEFVMGNDGVLAIEASDECTVYGGLNVSFGGNYTKKN
ncbi:hypothetical protein [Mesobacillus harenae]|uniref:hypothetical protein n=1 Tax=Mesobacillus harenae TaxID=2213203 RepID=UPI001580B16F|nr:hypothetical protein [Mesobacillus harenae]